MLPLVFEAIGTRWQIDLGESFLPEKTEELLSRITARIEEFDKHYSRFREDSLVSEMARNAGVYSLPEDALPMLSLYRELYGLTEGAMTPLVGQMLVDAGYDATYTLSQTAPLRCPPRWEEVIEYDSSSITIKQPALLDFGAMGKGYLIDIVGDILRGEGIASFCIDAGGDIMYQDAGGASIRIGLENPENSEEVLGTIDILNESICGSSGNRRAWGKFHHIMDPRTQTSPRHIQALWVTAKSTLLADALSTALFFVDPAVLREKYAFEYVLLSPDYSVQGSPGFNAELFVQ